MRKIRFDCECGKCNAVIVDGFEVGDRLLEGVKFTVALENGKAKAKVKEEMAEYFSKFNERFFLENVELFVEDTDVVECANCGGEAVIVIIEE